MRSANEYQSYDPETVFVLSAVLERAAASLPKEQQTQQRKTIIASQLLGAAANGERDPIRLYQAALAVGPEALAPYSTM
jgi:hypothetical protein